MPRPPVLPVLDWSAVFNSGKSYQTWLAAGEDPEHRQRMEALRQSLRLPEAVSLRLKDFTRPVHVVAFAEDWCGDVVRHVPVLEKLAGECPQIHVRYLTRAERPDVFVRFLTNGGEAVPKFIFLSDQFVEAGSWGPMTAECREIIARGKACGDVGAARKRTAELYEADPECHEVAQELLNLVNVASTEKL